MVLHIDENNNTQQKPTRKRRRILYEWIRVVSNEDPHIVPHFHENLTEHESSIKLPIEYFKQFLTDEILDIIVTQSNLYASQKNPDKQLRLSRDEFEQWLGISMRMSLTKISDTRLHWSEDSQCEAITNVMTRMRWEEIKNHLHLVDNTTINQNDKIAKVRILVNHLRTEFQKIPMTEHLSIDEQMVPFKGSSSLKQYIPKKPYKWGYKMFVLADHKGMVYDFFPYEGKIMPVQRDGIPDLGPSSNSVLILAESIPEGKNHKLYIDNWFTSLPLVAHLAERAIWVCGTVQARRLPNLSFKEDKALAKTGRGTFDELYTTVGDSTINAIKWFDNRSVCLVSSFVNSLPVEFVERYDKKTKQMVKVSIPQMVKMYNAHMGGVDLHDQIMSYYRMSFRSKKYYLRLIFHLFDMMVVNSWQLYRRDADAIGIPVRKQDSLLRFKWRLANSLLRAGKSTTAGVKRGRPSSVAKAHIAQKKIGHATRALPEDDIRLDQMGHFPEFRAKRGMCKFPNCKGRVLIHCIKCNVPLCIERSRNCFHKFHTE